MSDEDSTKNTQYKETKLNKFIIHLIFFVLLVGAFYEIVHHEFSELKKNENTKNIAVQMLSNLQQSSENLQDAWNTLYYFYQTGDLMNILKCPTVNKFGNASQENTLLMLYREKINKNDNTDDDELKSIRCGGNITVNVGLKDEIYKHSNDVYNFNFKLGEEPIKMLEMFPFIKNAITKLREGEKATFVVIMKNKFNKLKPTKITIYDLEIPVSPSNSVITTPLYIETKKDVANKYYPEKNVYCGAVVYFTYSIYDINNKKIYSSKEILNKIKIGSGELNDFVEHAMIKMQLGDASKIFLTKNMLKKSKFLPDEIVKKNNILIVDVQIVNLQK